MVLEIINSCLTNTLHHNPNLVYTLLHRRELFAQFRTHPTFQDIIQNIDTVNIVVSITLSVCLRMRSTYLLTAIKLTAHAFHLLAEYHIIAL